MNRFVLSLATVVLVLAASGQARAENFEDCKYFNHFTGTWDLDYTKMRLKMDLIRHQAEMRRLASGYQQPSLINPSQPAPNLQQFQQPTGYWFYDPYYGWVFYPIR